MNASPVDWRHWTTGAWVACIALVLAAACEWLLDALCGDGSTPACTHAGAPLLWAQVALLVVAAGGVLYACWRGWQRMGRGA